MSMIGVWPKGWWISTLLHRDRSCHVGAYQHSYKKCGASIINLVHMIGLRVWERLHYGLLNWDDKVSSCFISFLFCFLRFWFPIYVLRLSYGLMTDVDIILLVYLFIIIVGIFFVGFKRNDKYYYRFTYNYDVSSSYSNIIKLVIVIWARTWP